MLNYAEEREVNILRSKQKPAEFGVEKLKPTIEPKETRRCQESESTGSRRRSSRIAGMPVNAVAHVKRQPMSVKALFVDVSGPAKRYNP